MLFFYTLMTLVAFAANSIMCRLALLDGTTSPESFTAIRLSAGTITLFFILWLTQNKIVGKRAQQTIQTKGAWAPAVALFVYLAGFSLAYQFLDTGTGALILFSSVQLTMLSASLVRGVRFGPLEWVGIALSCLGFLYLLLPGATKPDLMGFLFMSAAGVGWGSYTMIGRRSLSPLSDTTWNFGRCLALCVVPAVFWLAWPTIDSMGRNTADIRFELPLQGAMSAHGFWLALASGSVASGLGYALWYAVLPRLTASVASLSQLSVPIIASFGGLWLADEQLSMRLVVASALVIGGIFLVVQSSRQPSRP